jgi:hypothetical protein
LDLQIRNVNTRCSDSKISANVAANKMIEPKTGGWMLTIISGLSIVYILVYLKFPSYHPTPCIWHETIMRFMAVHYNLIVVLQNRAFHRIYQNLILLLIMHYNSGRVLAFSTMTFHLGRSWTCSFHLTICIRLMSFLIIRILLLWIFLSTFAGFVHGVNCMNNNPWCL